MVGGLCLALGAIAALSVVVVADTLISKPRAFGPWVLLALSAWLAFTCLLFSARLLLNRPGAAGGLMSPASLRFAAVFFGGLPIASLFTGAWRNNHLPLVLVLLQCLVYLGICVSLFRLASRRAQAKE